MGAKGHIIVEQWIYSDLAVFPLFLYLILALFNNDRIRIHHSSASASIKSHSKTMLNYSLPALIYLFLRPQCFSFSLIRRHFCLFSLSAVLASRLWMIKRHNDEIESCFCCLPAIKFKQQCALDGWLAAASLDWLIWSSSPAQPAVDIGWNGLTMITCTQNFVWANLWLAHSYSGKNKAVRLGYKISHLERFW